MGDYIRILLAGAVLSTSAVAKGGRHGAYDFGSSHSSSHTTSEHYVSGYFRGNGTYVSGHHQTNPNGTRNDNYSTRGNVNPHTGEPGTMPRDEDTPH